MNREISKMIDAEIKKAVEKTAGAELPSTQIGDENNKVDNVSDASLIAKPDETKKKGVPTEQDKKIGDEKFDGDKHVGDSGLDGKTITEAASSKKVANLSDFFSPEDASPEKVAALISEAYAKCNAALEKSAGLNDKEVKSSFIMKMAYALETVQSKNKEMSKQAEIESYAEKLAEAGVYDKKAASVWIKTASATIDDGMIGYLVEQRIRTHKLAFSEGLGGSTKEASDSIKENAFTRLLSEE